MILLADNFQYFGKKPLDSRFVYNTINDMVNTPDSIIYDGILVYNKETEKFYVFKSTNTIDSVLGKWEIFNIDSNINKEKFKEYIQNTLYKENDIILRDKKLYVVNNDFTSDNTQIDVSDSFTLDLLNSNLIPIIDDEGSKVIEYIQNENYKKNTLVYLNDKIARVKDNYKSDNTIGFTIQESFEDDVKNNKISVINTDHVHIMNEYAQSNTYSKDTLIYNGDLIARVMNDFIADDTSGNSINDSFEYDITLGNLLILNKEAELGIKPYKQGTFFSKDKLVFADGRIGRVLQDYISDNTGATIEESINIDIKNGNLREMAESYKFKLYKTTKDMNKQIDAINILNISDIVFENGEDIRNMYINEAIYGPLGTLALIKEIDINLGQIKAQTVNSREMEFMPPAPNTYKYNITLAGTGYSIGEIIQTTLPGVNVEITEVDSNGGILIVSSSTETIISSNGTGANIEAELILYTGNGKQWYEIPEKKQEAILKEYIPGEFYKKDSLIFFEDILVKSEKDFFADSIMTTIKDSFQYDLTSGNITRLTREDVNVPECLGSCKTDNSSDLPSNPIKGNWVLIEDCVNASVGQAGIGLYNGSSWEINLIPKGSFVFPEPNDDGKIYFRKRNIGDTNGIWEALTVINGNDIEVKIKSKNDLIDNLYVPKERELVWDTNREILVIGDGVTPLGNLNAFYGSNITSADILAAIGFTPEDSSKKGQANGYAPLDENGLVPVANLPASLTDTYSKTEIDNKDIATLNSATTLVNTEATRAKNIETGLRTDLDTHINDTNKHVTQSEKDSWDAKVDISDLTSYDNHISDSIIHVTQSDKDKWNGMNKAYFVTNVSDLPATGNQIGNIGYVQKSAIGVIPMVCDQYLWNGTSWSQLDSSQVSLQFDWGNLQGKPASTPLSIDNTVTIAHNHNNKIILDKIGQSVSGNFTYDGVEIGVKVVFLLNENLLSPIGEANTLYVIYEDSRVRNYPSISVYRDGSYQILGRGTQDTAPVVGDMNILQSEYFSVVKGSKYKITVSSNQYFAFMPVEILREIEGLKDQQKIIITVNNPDMFNYNEKLLNITESSKLTISIKELDTDLDTVSNFYYSHVDVNLDDYKDIDNIG